MRSTLRAVLFDLDGVLIDSYEVWRRLINAAAVRFNAEPITSRAFRDMWGQGVDADAARLGCSVADLERFYNDYFMNFGDAMAIDPAAKTVLDRVHQAGLRSAVITNTPAGLARQILATVPLAPEVVVGGDDVPHAKPAPDMVLRACVLLGVLPSQAVVVGDSDFDRQAAAESRVRFIGLRIDGDAKLARLGDLPGLLQI